MCFKSVVHSAKIKTKMTTARRLLKLIEITLKEEHQAKVLIGIFLAILQQVEKL